MSTPQKPNIYTNIKSTFALYKNQTLKLFTIVTLFAVIGGVFGSLWVLDKSIIKSFADSIAQSSSIFNQSSSSSSDSNTSSSLDNSTSSDSSSVPSDSSSSLSSDFNSSANSSDSSSNSSRTKAYGEVAPVRKQDACPVINVTINQAATQTDPTLLSPVKFTAVFSSPINPTTFTASQITLTGTAPGKTVTNITQVAPNDGTTFEVTVTATGVGTVVAEVKPTVYVSSILAATSNSKFLKVDSQGNIYAGSTSNNIINKISPSGIVSTISNGGLPINDIVIDSLDNVYVANGNQTVTKITSTGISTTIPNTGTNTKAIAVDSLDNLYTANDDNPKNIIKITPGGATSIVGNLTDIPRDLVVDAIGNIYTYAADILNNPKILKTTSAGVTSTLLSLSTLPNEIAIDTSGNLYTANRDVNTVSKITPGGIISLFGNTGSRPLSIAVDSSGNVFTGNYDSNNVTKITPAGISTIIGSTGVGPVGIAVDEKGNIYTANELGSFFGSSNFTKISPSGITNPSGCLSLASTSTDNSVTIIPDTVRPTATINQAATQADPTNSGTINFTAVFSEAIDPNTFTASDITLTGTSTGAVVGTPTTTDNITWNIPITATVAGTVIANLEINTVTDVAGNGNDAATFTDNSVTYAISCPIINSTINQAILQIDPTTVSPVKFTAVFTSPINPATFTASQITLTGSAPGKTVSSIVEIAPNNGTTFEITVTATGSGTVIADVQGIVYVSSTFSSLVDNPSSITIDSAGNIYTANPQSNNVTKITPAGVSSIFGTTGNLPYAITIDSAGNIYTANRSDNNVTKITPAGVSTILGTTGLNPNGIAIDAGGNIYTTNLSNSNVTKITPAGVSTVFGNAGFSPQAIKIDASGNIFVSNNDAGGSVRKITPAGVSTIFGTTGSFPTALVIDAVGNVYTANQGSNNVTKITPAGVSTIFGTTGTAPTDITIDLAGNIFTVNSVASNITRITPTGVTTVFVPTGGSPKKFLIDSFRNIYTTHVNSVKKLTPTGITNLAGCFTEPSTSTDNTITIDTTRPTATINQAATQADPTNGGTINFTAVFSEAINPTTFTSSDITLTGTSTGAVVGTPTTTDNITWNIPVTSTVAGTMIANLGINTVTDVAGNGNNAATFTDNSVTKKFLTVTINQAAGQTDPTYGNIINFTAVFSEAINPSTFTFDDVRVTGDGTITGVTSSTPTTTDNITWNIPVFLPTLGTISVSLDENKITDIAGNGNIASTSIDNGVTYILACPAINVTINQKVGQSDPTFNSPILFTATFSAPIDPLRFTPSKIALSGTATGAIVTSIIEVAPNNGTTFEISVTTTGIGTVVADINGGDVTRIFGLTDGSPLSIATDVFGNVYTANLNGNSISKITPAGISSTFASGLNSPRGLAFDNSGNLFTVSEFDRNITKITPLGVKSTFGSTSLSPNDLVIDNDGNVYTANVDSNNVTKITPAGVSTTFGNTGANPFGITKDSLGNIYTSNGAGNITKITPAGVSTTFGNTGPLPWGIIVDSVGNIYTSSVINQNVVKTTPAGVSSILGSTGVQPRGVNIDAVGNIYVANEGSNNVTKITPGGVSTIFGATGISPYDIAIDSTGNIYVSNTTNQVSRFGFFDGNTSTCISQPSTSTDNEITIIADTTPPSATINQAVTQVDPTTNTLINFTVVFSELINPSTFTASDITLSGTSTGATVSTLTTIDNITWNIPVTASVAGTVIANLASNKITDLAGNNNIAATFTDNEVTYGLPNVAPIGTDDTLTVPEDTVISNPAFDFDVLANDTDADLPAQPLTITNLTQPDPSQGVAYIFNNKIRFVPAPNFNTNNTGNTIPITFTYTANDGTLDSNTVTVTVNVTPVNDAPIADNDDQSGTPLTEDGANGVVNVIANDTDIDAALFVSPKFPINNNTDPRLDGFTVDLDTATAGIQNTVTNSTGIWTLNEANGEVTFDPADNYNGTATLTYQLCDNGYPLGIDVLCSTALITFVVNAVNDLPVGLDDSYTVNENSTGANPNNRFDVLANDTDVDNSIPLPPNQGLTITNLTQPIGGSTVGTVTLFTSTGFGIPDLIYFNPAPNFNNTSANPVTFTYTASDGNGNSNVVTVSVVVENVNDDPIANGDNYTVNEDSNPNTPNTPANQFDILVNDVDPDGHTEITIDTNTNPTNGTITIEGTGDTAKIYYTPNANYNGPDSFTYTITDGFRGSAPSTTTVNITVTPVNDTPIANDDDQSATPLTEDGANGVVDILANDTDIDGNPTPSVRNPLNDSAPGLESFTVDLDTATAGLQNTITNSTGIWTLDVATGEVTFDPSNNFNGTATLTYELCDSGFPIGINVLCDTALITFVVSAVNDLPVGVNDDYTVIEDSLATDAVNTFDVLINDTDIDNPGNSNAGLTITNLTQPRVNEGFVSIVNNKVVFTPGTNYTNTPTTKATFKYTANDGVGNSNVVTVSVLVTPTNDAPVAVDNDYVTAEDSGANTFDVLDNDTDVDLPAQTLSITNLSTIPASQGTLAIVGNKVVFTPANNYNNTPSNRVSFTYTANDGIVDSNVVTVNVEVTPANDAPEANTDAKTVSENSNGVSNEIDVLANDTDLDNTSALAPQPANTGLTIVPASITLPANLPAHGTITIVGTGSSAKIKYVPTPGYVGNDSFKYTITDGGLDPVSGLPTASTATVNIIVANVNDNPNAVLDTYTVAEDSNPTTPNTPANQFDVLSNDTDADGHTQLSIVPGSILVPANLPLHGTIAIIGTGDTAKIYYTPNANYNGSDSFKYAITDGQLDTVTGLPSATSTAAVIVIVTPTNDAPVAVANDYVIAEDSGANTFDVLANDTDVDLPTPTLSITNLSTIPASQGTLAIVGNKVAFTPAPNYNNTPTTKVTFTYTANDGTADSNVVTVNVEVTPTNDTPQAVDDIATVTEDSDGTLVANQIKVLANDTDVDGNATLSIDPASILVPANLPAHGTITIVGSGNTAYIKYVPNLNYNGLDSFKYTAIDGAGGSSTATVNVTVTGVNDLPAGVNDDYIVVEDSLATDTANTFDVLSNDTDIDLPAQALTITNLTQPLASQGTVSIANNKVVFIPAANYNNTPTTKATFTYTANDGTGNSNIVTVTVLVTGVVDVTFGTIVVPSISNNPKPQIIGTCETGASVTIKITSGDTNPSLQTDQQTLPSFTCSPSGTYNVTPNTNIPSGNYCGIATFVNFDPNTLVTSPSCGIIDTLTFITVSAPAITNNTKPTIIGTCESGGTVTIKITTGATNNVNETLPSFVCGATGTYSVTPNIDIPAGPYCANGTIVDPATNTATSTASCGTVDTSTAVTISVPALTNNTKPTIIGTCESGGTVTIKITTGATNNVNETLPSFVCSATGTFSVTPTVNIPSGPYCATGTIVDPATNTATSTASCGTVDTSTAVTISVPALTNNPTPPITGTCETGGTVTIKITNGATNNVNETLPSFVCSATGTFSVTPTVNIPSGPYCATGTIVDAAGNTATATPSCGTIDTSTFITTSVPAITNNPTPPITGTCETGGTVTIKITNGAVSASNPNPTVLQTLPIFVCEATGTYSATPPTAIAQGPYCSLGNIVDTAGNTADSASGCGVVDTSTFATIVVPSITNNPRPPIIGTCESGANVVLTITIGQANTLLESIPAFTCDASQTYSKIPSQNIPQGAYCVKINATDLAGNTASMEGCGNIFVTVNVPPTSTNPNPEITGTCTPSIAGGFQVPVKITIKIGTNNVFSEELNTFCSTNGTFNATVGVSIPTGQFTATAIAIDSLGNEASATSTGIIETLIINGSTIIIAPERPKAPAPEEFVNISDPYQCGKSITGKVTDNYGIKSVVVKLFASLRDGAGNVVKDQNGNIAYDTNPKYIFRPTLDKDGSYEIAINYDDENIFVKGDYKVEYLAQATTQAVKSGVYTAKITNECNIIIPVSVQQIVEITPEGKVTIRTGGNNELYFVLLTLALALSGFGYWKLRRRETKAADVFRG
jgi:Bacterial Ig domain/Bacterial cadherin-like domain/Bacterial Ig-like domain